MLVVVVLVLVETVGTYCCCCCGCDEDGPAAAAAFRPAPLINTPQLRPITKDFHGSAHILVFVVNVAVRVTAAVIVQFISIIIIIISIATIVRFIPIIIIIRTGRIAATAAAINLAAIAALTTTSAARGGW
jgi:hypothetical protein